MRALRKTMLVLLSALALAACRKPTGAHWDVDATLPLVNCVLDIKNFRSDSIFSADNDGLLNIRLNRQVAAILLDSLLSLPQTTLSVPLTYTYGFDYGLLPGTTFTFDPSDITFNVTNGTQLKRVDVRSGKIEVTFSNNLVEPLLLTYRINEVTKNGLPFEIKEIIPPGQKQLVKQY